MNNGYGFTKGSPEYLEICKQIKLLESLGMTKAECTKTLIDMHGFTRKAANKLVKKVLTKQPWGRYVLGVDPSKDNAFFKNYCNNNLRKI